MYNEEHLAGHIVALGTILIWGTTYVSTKVLLTDFAPIEILFLRSLLGFIALFCVCPKFIHGLNQPAGTHFCQSMAYRHLPVLPLREYCHGLHLRLPWLVLCVPSLQPAFLWAIYSVLTRKIVAMGIGTVASTRHMFCHHPWKTVAPPMSISGIALMLFGLLLSQR